MTSNVCKSTWRKTACGNLSTTWDGETMFAKFLDSEGNEVKSGSCAYAVVQTFAEIGTRTQNGDRRGICKSLYGNRCAGSGKLPDGQMVYSCMHSLGEMFASHWEINIKELKSKSLKYEED